MNDNRLPDLTFQAFLREATTRGLPSRVHRQSAVATVLTAKAVRDHPISESEMSKYLQHLETLHNAYKVWVNARVGYISREQVAQAAREFVLNEEDAK